MRTGLRRRSRGWIITAWLAGGLAVVLVVGALVGYAKYRQLWDGIHRDVISGLGHRPPKYNDALNILIFGSDSRAGLTPHEQFVLHVGHEGCGCSDTIMVVHISPGRHRVTVLNIPRDTMVPMYGCPPADGKPGEQENPTGTIQINQTLAAGGPSCLWKTVEHATGIHLDHFIQLEFTGVVKVINDLGGVSVCVPEDIDDPNSGLHITAGRHHIDGLTFLEFWRARETVADGSDLKRIDRDDLLLAQVLRGVLHQGLLTSPTRLLPVVEDAAHAIYATDAGLTQGDILQIVSSFRGLTSNDVQFIEAPTQPYPPAPAQVEFVQPADQQLFSAIAHDSKLPHRRRVPRRHRGPAPATVAARDVQVEVLNGTTVPALAAATAAGLTARGFDVVGTPGNAGSSDYANSVIQYAGPADRPAAATLARQVSHVTLRRSAAVPAGTVRLILGSSFSALAPAAPAASGAASASPSSAGASAASAAPVGPGPAPASGSPSPSTSVGGLARTYGGITGTATCRTDASAFQP
jgi:LCP family protein required for cell wall assembly